MKRGILYVSGPMTGFPEFNKPAFYAAEQALRAAGFEVVNPVDNGVPDDAEWHQHMRADIKMLMDCTGVALLPGWLKSNGARLEADIAVRLGMRVEVLADWLVEAAA
jgi:hypothetical protein